jgi:sugar phosphate permease
MAFPDLAPIFGIVASLMFSIAYSSSNIFMSALSTKWNKRAMLAVAILGFTCTTLVSGATSSLLLFATMRFMYGVFASAINTPIY